MWATGSRLTMAENARKHTIPGPGDTSISRATIFETFPNTINDIVPVANATERAQVVAALVAAGVGPTTTKPLFVSRADAPGLYRLEVTFDGTVFMPVAGGLRFTDVAAANSFGTAYPGLLNSGDRARVGSAWYVWSGSAWVVATQTVAHQLAGVTLAGVTIANAVVLPGGAQKKTGQHTFFTTTSFGNEYAPAVTFDTAFPNGLLSLQFTQIQADGALAYSTIAYDSASTTGFRAMYPGGSTPTKRSFTWVAEGY
jgi:hypothetical protein